MLDNRSRSFCLGSISGGKSLQSPWYQGCKRFPGPCRYDISWNTQQRRHRTWRDRSLLVIQHDLHRAFASRHVPVKLNGMCGEELQARHSMRSKVRRDRLWTEMHTKYSFELCALKEESMWSIVICLNHRIFSEGKPQSRVTTLHCRRSVVACMPSVAPTLGSSHRVGKHCNFY